MVGYLIFELRRLLRIRALLWFGTLVPLVIYVVVTLPADMTEQDRGIPLAALVMVMVAAFGAIIGVLTHAAGIAYERADGWLQQLRATPLPPSRIVTVRAVVSLLTVLPPLAAVATSAVLLHGLVLSPARWVLVVVVMWWGAAPFALLGLTLGFTLTRDLTGPATGVAWLVLAILGGLMVSVDSFPGWLQPVSRSMPSYRYAEIGWRAVDGTPPTVTAAAILAGWSLLFGLLAVLAYRRWSAVR